MARRRYHDGLSKEQVSNYLRDQSKCPFCGSSSMIRGVLRHAVTPEGVVQNIRCWDCMTAWRHVYCMHTIELSISQEEPAWL